MVRSVSNSLGSGKNHTVIDTFVFKVW